MRILRDWGWRFMKIDNDFFDLNDDDYPTWRWRFMMMISLILMIIDNDFFYFNDDPTWGWRLRTQIFSELTTDRIAPRLVP